jgi:anti-sigma regulatory factor (Ser/Thr protein kinase)/DNA-binding XRE family transcriptional regulator
MVTESRFAHAGHLPDSPLMSTGIPDMPRAPACCLGQHWIVTLDGERLRQARTRRGLSQKELAEEAGVGVRTVGKLERQDRPRCHFRTRARLAMALGAHPQALTAAPDRLPGIAQRAAETVTAVPGAAGSGPGWKCSRTFPARADQVGQARAFLGRVLAGCPVLDELLLICSELTSNAVQHSDSARPGGQFTVRAEVRERDYAWIEVEDQGGRWVRKDRSDERGRGLVVVDGIAAYWDIRGDDTGRVVCARLDWPPVRDLA